MPSGHSILIFIFTFSSLFPLDPASISGPILVKNALNSIKVAPKEGDSFVQLHCPITANPEPIAKWVREDNGSAMDWFRVKFELAKRGHEFISILTVFNVTREDAGLYSCSAHNSINVGASTRSVRVHVEYRPTIRKSSDNKVAADVSGESARLMCLAIAYPSVQFDWSVHQRDSSKYKIVNMVNTTGEPEGVELYRSDLIISKLREADFGRYRCRAYNHLGEDTFDIDLVPKGEPGDFHRNTLFLN